MLILQSEANAVDGVPKASVKSRFRDFLVQEKGAICFEKLAPSENLKPHKSTN